MQVCGLGPTTLGSCHPPNFTHVQGAMEAQSAFQNRTCRLYSEHRAAEDTEGADGVGRTWLGGGHCHRQRLKKKSRFKIGVKPSFMPHADGAERCGRQKHGLTARENVLTSILLRPRTLSVNTNHRLTISRTHPSPLTAQQHRRKLTLLRPRSTDQHPSSFSSAPSPKHIRTSHPHFQGRPDGLCVDMAGSCSGLT